MERQGPEKFEQVREQIIKFLSSLGIGRIDIPSKKFPVALDGDCLIIGDGPEVCKLICADDGFCLSSKTQREGEIYRPPILFTTISAFKVILNGMGNPSEIIIGGRLGNSRFTKVNVRLTEG